MSLARETVDFIKQRHSTGGFIPLHAPVFRGQEKEYLNRCIDTTFVSSVGEFVDRFEKDLQDFTGAAAAVAVMNGTAALHAALHLVGTKHGDLVITQPLTFVATCNAITQAGALPAFVDINLSTLGMDPEALNDFLKKQCDPGDPPIHRASGRKVSACIPMHTFGHPMDIDGVAGICEKWGIPLVEDAAESLGSYTQGRHTGLAGHCGILSFNGNKTITTGGGGAIITDDIELGRRAKHITTTAKIPHRWDFVHDMAAFNYRMPNINAALGCAQLEQLPAILNEKKVIAAEYRDFFRNTDWTFVDQPEGTESNFWLNAVLTSNREERDELLGYSNDHDVMTRPAWELMTALDMYGECPRSNDLSQSEDVRSRLVNLPSGVSNR